MKPSQRQGETFTILRPHERPVLRLWMRPILAALRWANTRWPENGVTVWVVIALARVIDPRHWYRKPRP